MTYRYRICMTLESRRKVTDLCNLNKVYCNHVNSPYIVSQITFNIPSARNRHARRDRLFSVDCRINLRKNTYIPRVLSLANSNKDVDIFEPDKVKFKRSVVAVFR